MRTTLLLASLLAPSLALQQVHTTRAATISACARRQPLLPAASRLRGGGARIRGVAQSPPAPPARSPALPLQLTAFVFMVGISLVTLTPAPYMVEKLGVERGMRLLTALATTSAGAEIGLSPIFGGLTDSLGRKPVLIGMLLIACLSNVATAVWPSVALVALSKFVASLVIGIFFLAAGAILADNFRGEPAKLASASGILFALVNGSFGLGVALSGLLPSGLRFRYAISATISLCGLLLGMIGIKESLPVADRVPFQMRSFNPFAFTRLLAASRAMRLLSVLMALSLAPLFMGDTLQVFCLSHWKLSNAQVSQLFTGVAIQGVIANTISGALIKRLGLQLFTVISTASTLLFWAGFSTGVPRVAMIGAVVGLLGPARTLGASTMITSEGSRLGIPQGQLSGDRANLVAWLKVLGPLVYGQLYVTGTATGMPTLPFVLNCGFALAALLLVPVALAPASS